MLNPSGTCPILDGADYAVVYYDRDAGKKSQSPGRWKTVVKRGDSAHHDLHRTQRDACRYIGMPNAGSMDEAFKPFAGEYGRIVAIDAHAGIDAREVMEMAA